MLIESRFYVLRVIAQNHDEVSTVVHFLVSFRRKLCPVASEAWSLGSVRIYGLERVTGCNVAPVQHGLVRSTHVRVLIEADVIW